MGPLLITRAADEAAILVARLGVGAVAAPCLEWETVRGVPPVLPDADLLVTSPRAVPGLLAAGVDASWRVLALAPATAAACVAAGLRVDIVRAGGASALARAARRDAYVLHATSDLGGAEVLRVRPDARIWVVYRTACPASLPPSALAALGGPYEVLFCSPSAIDHFERLAPGALIRADAVLCHGRTTLAALARRGLTGRRVDLATLTLR